MYFFPFLENNNRGEKNEIKRIDESTSNYHR